MTVTPTTAVPSATQQTINTAQKSLASDQQTFFTLLTAQLRNQDPLSPLDTNQFTQQLVAMTGVQQQIVANQLLQQMVDGRSGIGDPVGLIGKTVTADTAQAPLASAKADWLYALDAPASKVLAQVYDSMDRLIWSSQTGPLAAGEQAVTWDGKDALGNQRPDGGTYKLKVTAVDANGKDVGAKVYRRGLATSIVQDNGQTLVNIGGVKVPTSQVNSVS
jgi:flagellar basal-body rod modification protein FlgD